MIGHLNGHDALRRHLHWMGLINTPLCRWCWVEDETLAHVLCDCEALTSLSHVHLGSFFLDPQDINLLKPNDIYIYVVPQR